MIDYKGPRYHKLDGAQVHFGADFIFCDRHHSEKTITSAIIKAAMEYGTSDLPTVEDFESGNSHNMSPREGCKGEQGWSWSNIIRRTMEETDRHGQPIEEPPAVTPQPSKTLARVEFAGSDNYSCSQTSVALNEVRGPVS
jgi:hypothetical protein